jgi:outer membrane protein assembly factor BamB
MQIRIGLFCGLVLCGILTCARGENWSQFRGPAGNGLPTGNRLPSQWEEDQNIAWKVKLPGAAWSQPVVWGDRIIVTTAVTENQPKPSVGQGGRGAGGFGRGPGGRGGRGPAPDRQPSAPGTDEAAPSEPEAAPKENDAPDRPRASGADGPQGRRPGRGGFGRGAEPPDQVYRWMVLCLDRSTGKVLWEQVAHEGKPTIAIHRTNTYASETPATDGERVVAYFGTAGLYCYDMAGKLLWEKSLGSHPMMMGWGTGSSPVLDGDRVFLQCDNEKESFLVAIDKRTGQDLWRVTRDEKSSWSTPFIWKNKLRTELVAAGATMRAYDPADGHVLWELPNMRGRCSATPVGTADLLYVGVGGGMGGAGPLVAIRAEAEGNIALAKGETSNAGIAWRVPKAGPPMSSPLVYKDCVYVLEQRGGILGCYDAASGHQHYRQRIEGAKGFTASPWASDNNIYCLDEDGQTFVLAAGGEFKLLATNKLDDAFWSSAAVAGDHLLLRGVNNLYSIAPASDSK